MGPLYTHVDGKINNFLILWHYIDRQHKDRSQGIEFIDKIFYSAIKFSSKFKFVSVFSKRWVKTFVQAF